MRWGLAIAAVYWYNTSPIFMDELDGMLYSMSMLGNALTLPAPEAQTCPIPHMDEDTATVDAVIEKKRREIAASRLAPAPATNKWEEAKPNTDLVSTEDFAAQPHSKTNSEQKSEHDPQPEAGSPEALEEEANQQGAFNPETGEINWDCPCLGGMAHGPCGEEFKSAFSCFVYSEVEPKGMDCIEKFQYVLLRLPMPRLLG